MTDWREEIYRMERTGYFGRIDEGFLDNVMDRLKNGMDNVLANNFGSGAAQGRMEVRTYVQALEKEFARWKAITKRKQVTKADLNEFWRYLGVDTSGDEAQPTSQAQPTASPQPAANTAGKGAEGGVTGQGGATPPSQPQPQAQAAQQPAAANPTPATPQGSPQNPAAPASAGDLRAMRQHLPAALRRSLDTMSQTPHSKAELDPFVSGFKKYMQNGTEDGKKALIATLRGMKKDNPHNFNVHPELNAMLGESVLRKSDVSLMEMLTGDYEISPEDIIARLDEVALDEPPQLVTEDDVNAIMSDQDIRAAFEKAARVMLASGGGGNPAAGHASAPSAGGVSSGSQSSGTSDTKTGKAQNGGGSEVIRYSYTSLLGDLRSASFSEDERREIVEFARNNAGESPLAGSNNLQQANFAGSQQKAYQLLFIMLKNFGSSLS